MLSRISFRAIHVLRSLNEVRAFRIACTQQNKTVGLVPTMGYLHDGHMSLVKCAKQNCDVAIASIFVNPTQFLPGEDLAKYPRDFDGDCKKLAAAGADAVFFLTPATMYPNGYQTFVKLEGVDENSKEGSCRPGHFRGVATVVTKLFNLTQPTKAFFGQKDGMQCIVIKRMVQDLNMPIDIVVVPTKRHEDGLAMSSRNTYLSKEDRAVAPLVYQSLQAVLKLWMKGVREYDFLFNAAASTLAATPRLTQLYLDFADMRSGIPLTPEQLADPAAHPEGVMLSTAVRAGNTRLIDNIVLP